MTSKRAWARAKGVKRPVLNLVINGNRSLCPSVIRALGLEQVTTYRRKT